MNTVQLLKKAYKGNISQMSRDTGIPYQRLYKLRLQDGCDGRITLDELRSLLRHAEYPLTDEEILRIAKGDRQ